MTTVNGHNKLKLNSNIKNIQTPALQKLKPKPLQASTNLTRTHQNIQQTLKLQKNGLKSDDSDLKKPQNVSHQKGAKLKGKIKTTSKGSNENDETVTPQSYDPLNYQYLLDEELYQQVLKLELADDGIPEFKSAESFDF